MGIPLLSGANPHNKMLVRQHMEELHRGTKWGWDPLRGCRCTSVGTEWGWDPLVGLQVHQRGNRWGWDPLVGMQVHQRGSRVGLGSPRRDAGAPVWSTTPR